MAFCIVFGTTEFQGQLKGYENVTCRCHNCGNWSATPGTRWPWFTVCWVPVIPLGSKYKEVHCRICRFSQDIKNRPDVQSQMNGGSGGAPGPGGPGGPPPQQNYGGPNQGWNDGGRGGGQPPPQGQPVYAQQQQGGYGQGGGGAQYK